MSLQARMTQGDPRLYDPSRDVAHNFIDVVKTTAHQLEHIATAWPEMAQVLSRESVNEHDLGEACGALCTYLIETADKTKRNVSVEQAFTNAGFFNLKPAAQIAVMAMVGLIYSGMFYRGARQATMIDSGPLLEVPELVAAGGMLAKFVATRKTQETTPCSASAETPAQTSPSA
jgi:hypothetical protein